MSTLSREASIPANRDRVVSVRYLFRFSLPLALTFLMMSGAAPLVSNGITWMHGATGERIHLSAFLMTFVTALTLYSPMFVARNVAIRTITDRRSMRRYAVFFVGSASVSSVLLLVVSRLDGPGHLVFGILLNTTNEIEHLARGGLLMFVPIPILIALRGLGQGCHISNHEGWYVGAGTALRLATMAVFVFGYAIHHDLTGPVLGGGTYLAGIAMETLFVLVTLRDKPQWTRSENGPLLTLRQFGRYAGPLMLASVLNQLAGPILVYMINTGYRPGENGATYNLLRDTAWVMFSSLMVIQPAVVANATSRHNCATLLRFAGILVAATGGLIIAVALTPLKELIFIDVFKVDNEIIRQLTFVSLLWMIPVPLINMGNLFITAIHTRSGRTEWATAGNVAGLGLLVMIATGLDLSAHNGAVLAVISLALFNLTAAAVQVVGLFRGGLRDALSPHSLAEELHRRSTARGPADLAAEPTAEQVNQI